MPLRKISGAVAMRRKSKKTRADIFSCIFLIPKKCYEDHQGFHIIHLRTTKSHGKKCLSFLPLLRRTFTL